jgi:hypothetical protein
MQQSEDNVTVNFGKTDFEGSLDAGGGTMPLAATVSFE